MSPPIKYPMPETWMCILDLIARGASLSSVVQLPGMPTYGWCKKVLREHPELRKRYDEAVLDRADVLAEEIERIADEPIPGDLDGPGKAAWIARQRLRFDARRWASSKLAPRRYGDKVVVDVEGKISILAALDDAKRRVQQDEGRTIEGEVVSLHTESF